MGTKCWRIFLFVCILRVTLAVCPTKCTCKNANENGSALKVKCGGAVHSKITSLKELQFGDDNENVVQLDLSKNQISHLESSDFVNFTNLKRLDLSFNSLQQIDEWMFGEIPTLERLKLATNLIVHIFQGSFENLKSLKQLDISGNPLACDCDLLWLVGWSNNMSVKLQPPPKCESPPDFKGSVLKKLKVGSDLHCESPLQPLLELYPDKDQLVFEGDELVLRCRAPRVAVGAIRDSEDLPAKAHVFWGWSDKIVDQNTSEDIYYRDPSIHFPSIQIDAKHLSDSGLLDSILRIPFVTRNHSGMWDCRLRSHHANLSRTISVYVISDKTKYCESAEVRNNKGRYYWPRTMRGMEVKLPCVGDTGFHAYATQFCNSNGEWERMNTEMCPYISETTRILEQFAKVNLSIARGSVLESAKRLRNYTQSRENLQKLRDPTDFVFAAKTISNYLEFLAQEKDLGSMLLDIVSQLLLLPSILSSRAQLLNGSAADVVVAVEKAALYTPSTLSYKNNLAIEYFNIRTDSFAGITCTWFRSQIEPDKKTFQCNTASHTMELFRLHVDASIQVPSNFLDFPVSQKLMVAVYQNANLFPHLRNNTKLKLTSAVIGVKLPSDSTNSYSNLTEPISVMLRIKPFHNEISAPIPVRWDAELGDWTSDGCHFMYYFHSLLVFSCTQLGYYGLLQNKKYLNDFSDENAGAQFRVSPIGFYVGSLVLFLCAWINIVTYITSGSIIHMGRRQKHSLVNTWLALSILCLIFAIGIFQTEDYRICQIFGISIHYFSLCVVLWISVSVSNMYKRLSKRSRVPIDDLPKENVGRKPILGLYLVGYGIGLIICGISGAVNIREYASYSYCFLRSGPALSAMFVPGTILLLFLSILLVCVRCHITIANDQNGHLSEGTQGTENVDLELLEASPNSHMNPSDRYRSLTISSPTTSIQDDLEHTNGAQLRAHFIFLVLYSIAWLSAAASISTPFQGVLLYEEELFSAVFAIAACFLGFFILFFYGISRSDVRRHWSTFSCRNFCSPICCRKRSVIDLKEQQNTVTYHQACGTMNSTSRSNSQCSKNRPTSATNQLKLHSELNSATTLPRNDSPSKLMTSPANVMLINRQQFVHNPVMLPQDIPNADMFYNPNQINVARKFFKKQKRLAKRNNFELQRQIERGDFGDCGASDISSSVASYPKATRGMSIFSSGSKVNNTNIHIRNLAAEIGQFSKDSRQQNVNPNILSDSCNESDLIVDAERFVLGAAEGLRVLNTRTKLNNANEVVANIYTNVPETSQPQHEVVTMRADDKFRKSANVTDLLEQDELDMERNDLNSRDSDRTSTPLYVNSNIRNIMDESMTSEGDFDQTQISTEDMKANIFADADLSQQPDVAMNTVGLPIGSSTSFQSVPQVMNTSNDENMLELDRNEAYISEPLEISDRLYTNQSIETSGLVPQATPIIQKSKSVLSLDALTSKPKPNKCSDSFHESQVRSISCTNITEAGDEILGAIANPLPAKQITEKRLLSSPVLFSPSLCEIDDIPSPDDRRKPINLMHDDMSSNSDSLNLFSQAIRRNFVSSPTCESDLNYQNSELSIRSHGVYAPQPDNDMNITLTGEDNMFFPYQSSEISDIDDDENDFDDFNNCSNDCLLPPHEGPIPDEDDLVDDSHESIDELYQRITRRPNTSSMIVNSGGSMGEIDLSSMPIINSDCGEEVVEELEVSNENDDDSSQCSVISYIDPNGVNVTKE